MAEAKVVEKIEAGADEVWQYLGDFKNIQPGSGIESIKFTGEGVGMTRTISMANGDIVERLEKYSDNSRTFTYAIINDDGPLPFSNYSATAQLTDNNDNTTTIEWTGTFEPRGIDEEKAIRLANNIYSGLIQKARKALTG